MTFTAGGSQELPAFFLRLADPFDHEMCGLFAYARDCPHVDGPLGQTTRFPG